MSLNQLNKADNDNHHLTNQSVNTSDLNKQDNDVIVRVSHLSKGYKKNILAIEDVNFEIKKGSFHVFIGSNGAGKTTTIKCLINTFNFWKGEITIDGHPNRLIAAKEQLGYMPEKVEFPKFFSLQKLLNSLLMVSGVDRKTRKKRIDKVLKFLDLNEFRKRNPNRLSSGQQRKVLLAQALINNPQILIMDEPTAHLSPVARRELFSLLLKLKESGVTIFVSTHDLSEVDRYTDAVTIINKGKIVFSGSKNNKNLEDLFFEHVSFSDYVHDEEGLISEQTKSKLKDAQADVKVWNNE